MSVKKKKVNVEWFRNTEWDASLEAAYFRRLSATKSKSQFIRIQAGLLTLRFPEAALKLLRKYFEIKPSPWDLAQAYAIEAEAYAALGKVDEALTAYEKALQREQEVPGCLTQAFVDYPFMIAVHHKKQYYAKAMNALKGSLPRLKFPVEKFKWNSAWAFILSDKGELSKAEGYARDAAANADEVDSGILRHPEIGLVGKEFEGVLAKLKLLTNS